MVDAAQTGLVRHDLLTLLDLLKGGKIKPLIAERLPLEGARRAHEMLGEGGVLGKIVLMHQRLTEQRPVRQGSLNGERLAYIGFKPSVHFIRLG